MGDIHLKASHTDFGMLMTYSLKQGLHKAFTLMIEYLWTCFCKFYNAFSTDLQRKTYVLKIFTTDSSTSCRGCQAHSYVHLICCQMSMTSPRFLTILLLCQFIAITNTRTVFLYSCRTIVEHVYSDIQTILFTN